MSDWKVVSRDLVHGGREASRVCPSKQSAYSLARDWKRQGHDVLRIEGPNREVIGKEAIESWIAANPD
jgi:hypothetical protein